MVREAKQEEYGCPITGFNEAAVKAEPPPPPGTYRIHTLADASRVGEELRRTAMGKMITLATNPMFPKVRGRLTSVTGTSITIDVNGSERRQDLVNVTEVVVE